MSGDTWGLWTHFYKYIRFNTLKYIAGKNDLDSGIHYAVFMCIFWDM